MIDFLEVAAGLLSTVGVFQYESRERVCNMHYPLLKPPRGQSPPYSPFCPLSPRSRDVLPLPYG